MLTEADIIQLWKEIKLLQKESNRRFEQIEQRLELLLDEKETRFGSLPKEINRHFEEQKHEHLNLKHRLQKLESMVIPMEDKMTQFLGG
jgi:tetrahydromethanopterin S-methyltransferase subunit G